MFMEVWTYFPAVAVLEYYQKVSAIFKERRGGRRKQILDNLKKRRDAGTWNRKHYITLCEELNVDERNDLSPDKTT